MVVPKNTKKNYQNNTFRYIFWFTLPETMIYLLARRRRRSTLFYVYKSPIPLISALKIQFSEHFSRISQIFPAYLSLSSNIYEDTDLRYVLKGGSMKLQACRFMLRDPLAINSTAIESRRIELFKKPKIIEIGSRSSANARFTFLRNGTVAVLLVFPQLILARIN